MNAERPGLYLQQTDEEREDTKEGIRIVYRRRTNCPFLLVIVLSILPFTVFEYIFDIFKLFLPNTRSKIQVHWNSE
jgi:hypothetical protein